MLPQHGDNAAPGLRQAVAHSKGRPGCVAVRCKAGCPAIWNQRRRAAGAGGSAATDRGVIAGMGIKAPSPKAGGGGRCRETGVRRSSLGRGGDLGGGAVAAALPAREEDAHGVGVRFGHDGVPLKANSVLASGRPASRSHVSYQLAGILLSRRTWRIRSSETPKASLTRSWPMKSMMSDAVSMRRPCTKINRRATFSCGLGRKVLAWSSHARRKGKGAKTWNSQTTLSATAAR